MQSIDPASPYLPVGASAFPYAPELCAAITSNYEALGFAFPLTPQMLGDASVGLDIPYTAAKAFLSAAIGGSNST